VTFQLEHQTYAVPLEQVIRIIDMVSITPLPDVDRSVVGVINVHGAIVPVIDLRRQFQLPTTAWKRHTPILLTPSSEQMLGLIVDTVTQVLNASTEQILRVDEVLPGELSEVPLLQGLLRHASGELSLLLDLNHLFQPDQIRAVVEAADRLFRAQAEPPLPQVGAL
jgi:purine-binding chemotaxis protein CheW